MPYRHSIKVLCARDGAIYATRLASIMRKI